MQAKYLKAISLNFGLRLGKHLKTSPGNSLLSIVQEMLEALKALSTFFVENSLRTRRNLRGDIERRSLSINEEFVSIFKEVKEVRKPQQFSKKSKIRTIRSWWLLKPNDMYTGIHISSTFGYFWNISTIKSILRVCHTLVVFHNLLFNWGATEGRQFKFKQDYKQWQGPWTTI